ncbi:MAG: D-alanine--D-alanine ligase [Gammaproteobacteria bacterium]|nr:D-alanine--D-alanine ligase [Gammaproteobacteria bacterium]
MNDYGRVAVLYGGPSSEREVSLKSGAAVLRALVSRGVDAHGIDVQPDIASRLLAGGFRRVFLALHGRLGEDGAIQGFLEVLGLPYTGSGVTASAVAMDKALSKAVWVAGGVPTPEYALIRTEEDMAAAATRLGYPLIIKPVAEGSSIGITKVRDPKDLPGAYRLAADYGHVLAERCVVGAEYTCAILGGRALPVIRLETPQEFYDYEAKYVLNTTQYHCPAGLAPDEEREAQLLSLRAFEALGAQGWGRVDLMRDAKGRFYVLELNTAPGMTDHSLVPMAARAAGLSFEDLVLAILDQAGGAR